MSLEYGLSLVSPIIVIVGVLITGFKWIKGKLIVALNEGRAQILTQLSAIEVEVRQINGTVENHSARIARLEGAVFKLQEMERDKG